jgi:hypothetical protein
MSEEETNSVQIIRALWFLFLARPLSFKLNLGGGWGVEFLYLLLLSLALGLLSKQEIPNPIKVRNGDHVRA